MIPDNQAEMIRRLRLGNLRKLLHHRCGPTLPDDDAGREYLYELLVPISLGPHADLKMPNAIEVWAPWMSKDEAEGTIDQIKLIPIWNRKPTARELGDRLRLTNLERERLRLWTIAPYDLNEQERLEQRRAKKRTRMRELRQLRGAKPRAESLSRTKPWLTLGISRRTWERRRVANSCLVMLSKAAHVLASTKAEKTRACG